MADIIRTSDGKEFSQDTHGTLFEAAANNHQSGLNNSGSISSLSGKKSGSYGGSAYNIAIDEARAGNYDKVIRICSDLIVAKYIDDELLSKLYNLRGVAYAALGNKEKAIIDYEKSLSYDRDWTDDYKITINNLKKLGVDYSASKGKLTYPNGSVYEGDIAKGEANGYGKLTWPERTDGLYQEGIWKDGLFQKGKGKILKDKGLYEGEIIRFTYNGIGYEARHGIGKMTHKNGKIEEGNWIDDKFVR